jgi:hypothetical protein
VPHRDIENGSCGPYITAKEAPRWGRLKNPNKMRRFGGHRFSPPFVVVRRTSRPNDSSRAVGTLVTGSTAISVENHLIVCSPIDGTLAACRTLLEVLQEDATNTWLNRCIRCRHLTVGSVGLIPWA